MASNPCQIGKYCAIGDGIRIITDNHVIRMPNQQVALQRRLGFKPILSKNDPVIIGNNVWIGDASTILSGVRIGDGAVVGAGAVVTQNIPPFTVAVGVPARSLRERFSTKIINQLLEIRWWDWCEERMARNKAFFECDLSLNPDTDLWSLVVD